MGLVIEAAKMFFKQNGFWSNTAPVFAFFEFATMLDKVVRVSKYDSPSSLMNRYLSKM